MCPEVNFWNVVVQTLSLICLVIILYKDLLPKLQILPLPVPSCVALGKQPCLSGSHSKNGQTISPYSWDCHEELMREYM